MEQGLEDCGGNKVFVANEGNNQKGEALLPALALPIRIPNLPYPLDDNLKGILEANKGLNVTQKQYSYKKSMRAWQ